MRRQESLDFVKSLDCKVFIWGAAGKGTVLAHALAPHVHSSIFATDSHSARWGKYLESSGVQVLSPAALKSEHKNSVVIVSNPNHLSSVLAFLPEHEVISGSRLFSVR